METMPAVAVLPEAHTSDLPAVLPPADLLDGLADLLQADTRRASTRKSYADDVNAFETFAATAGIDDPDGRPAHPLWVAAWVVSMRDEGKAFATIERRVRGFGSDHRARGFADPTTHPIVVEALKKLRTLNDTPQKQAHALTTDDVKAIAGKIDDTTVGGARDKAMILLGFACALRVSELASVTVEDIALSDDRVALTIRDAKTAKAGKVQHVVAACSPDDDLCPVESVRHWLDLSNITTGPAFRGLTKHGTIRTNPISVRAIGDLVKARSKDAGVIGWADVTSHSLRRGWATSAAALGVPPATIKQHGRWKTSAAADRYVDNAGSEVGMAATRAVIAGARFADSFE